MSTPDLTPLLERYLPVLRYDSQEPYFADSAAEWTDNPGNELRQAGGTVLAVAPPATQPHQLSLGFLAPRTYHDGTAVTSTDCIADPSHAYVAQAQALHAQSQYANRTYGHWATDSDGHTWLAYWFWYFYNDYNLVGDLFPAGLHEGDWEMIQLRLGPDGQTPDLAVYAQHTHAEAKDWADVEKVGVRPVVYPARGSHASYFKADVFGLDWTGVWFDHADGKRPGPELTLEVVRDDDPAWKWAVWPGFWGGTQPGHAIVPDPFSDSSPRGPGGHGQWRDPLKLYETVQTPPPGATEKPPPKPGALPAPPQIELARDGASLRVTYTATAGNVARMIVAVGSGHGPARLYREDVSAPQGQVSVPANLQPGTAYDVHVSVATGDGHASASTEAQLPPNA